MIEWIHFLSSFWMMTVIWFVQIVHYPLFAYVPKYSRIEYSRKHQQWISVLVMPGMLIEAISLVLLGKEMLFNQQWILMLLSLLIIWGSTFFLQVPCHNNLLKDPNDRIVRKLVSTNWIRTFFWTLKTIIVGNYVIGS
ncbi:hypothetical protein DID78_03530 [Candidatus Marinamargulisbacteria bacterium SCGC AG-343-D04]|nr:hypothetical protein DID78_03530 [Candidatus Marinamargulisbacteria bacterium SCGC AG-343-D04]